MKKKMKIKKPFLPLFQQGKDTTQETVSFICYFTLGHNLILDAFSTVR